MLYSKKKNNSSHNNTNSMQRFLLLVWVETKEFSKIKSFKKIYKYISKLIKFRHTENKLNLHRKLVFSIYVFMLNLFYELCKYKKKNNIILLPSKLEKTTIVYKLGDFQIIEYQNQSLTKNLNITNFFQKLKNYEQIFLFLKKKLYQNNHSKEFDFILKTLVEFTLLSREINTIINKEIYKKLSFMEKELNSLKKLNISLIKEKRLNILKKQKEENLKATREIKRYLSRNKEKFLISNKEKIIIFDQLKTSGNILKKFSLARDRIAHCLMGVYGLSIKDFKYINLIQLDNFYNQRSIFVKFLERGFSEQMELPYIKEGQWLIDKTYQDYLFVKNFVKRKIKTFHKKLKNKFGINWMQKRYSEVWGTISREHFSRRINSQLKRIGKEFFSSPKNIKSYSYKWGIATAILQEKGILAAKKAFFQKSLDNIELPLLSERSNTSLLQEYFKIGVTKDINNYQNRYLKVKEKNKKNKCKNKLK